MKIALIVALASLCLAAVVSQVSETAATETAAVSIAQPPLQTDTTIRSAEIETGEPASAPAATVPVETVTTLEVTGGHDLLVEDHRATPLRVRVPALDIDIDLLSVGVDDEGDFDVPRSGVGWYRFGPSPGDDGSTVLAAHVDYNGSPGAFFRLGELGPGDEIEIDSDDGITRIFVVVEQILFDKTALPADELFREDGDQALRLITCGGTFDHEARSYVGNRVVTAIPQGERPTNG